MTKQITLDNTVVDLTPVSGDIYVATPGNYVVEVEKALDYSKGGDGKIVAMQVDRVKYAVPLPEWESWAIRKWSFGVVEQAKRLLWMHT